MMDTNAFSYKSIDTKNCACYNDDENTKYNSCNYSITRNAVCQCVREKLFVLSRTERRNTGCKE